MWNIVGQKDSIELIEKALESRNLSHAYLLAGPPHTGKTTLAFEFSMALNCQSAHPPCRACNSCQRIYRSLHTDIFYIAADTSLDKNGNTAKNRIEISIDDIRKLQQFASLPPYEGQYKIFIINGADQLSNEAANSLLKTLEEPAPKVILILIASDETKVLPTVISRCQRILLRPLSLLEIEEYLVAQFKTDVKQAKLLSRLSGGHLGFAIDALKDDNILSERNRIISEMTTLLKSNFDLRFSYVAKLYAHHRNMDLRTNTEFLINIWISWWQDLVLTKSNCIENITNLDFTADLNNYANKLSLDEIREFIHSLQNSLLLILKNANIRLVLEVLMLDMPLKFEVNAF